MIREIAHILTLDIGNTRTKWAFFAFDALVEEGTIELSALPQLIQLWSAGPGLDAIGWMSVGQIDELPLGDFPLSRVLQLHTGMELPITHHYQTPETLGIDRIVGVIAAQHMVPDRPVLVIDAGTALTFDYADSTGAYRGGAIAPGMRMRFQALHHFTARLPLVQPATEIAWVGDTTLTAIQSGVIHGMTQEIQGTIQHYQTYIHPQIQVFLTGGDGPFFEKRLKNVNFAVAHLVHLGIHHIVSRHFEPNRRGW